MILGLGNDILDMRRIEKLYTKWGSKFLDRIYTKNEQASAFQQKDPIRRLAMRFAAKEAAAKALGLGLRSGVAMIDIEVTNDSNGKPILALHKNALKHLSSLMPYNLEARIDLALSDDFPYCLANVLISAH